MVALSINGLELEPDSKHVRYRGVPCSLTPTSFDLLECLMHQAPAVVSVDELLEEVWRGKVVDRATVKQQIKALRTQLGEAGDLVESVRGHGYRIQATKEACKGERKQSKYRRPIVIFAWLGVSLLASLAAGWYLVTRELQEAPPSVELPLIVVILPFEELGDRKPGISRVLQDDLTTALWQYRDFRALGIATVEHALREQYSPAEFAAHHQVDMIFEGTIRQRDRGYQINIRMLWTATGVTVWREQLNIDSPDRERVVQEVIATLEPLLVKKAQYIRERQE